MYSGVLTTKGQIVIPKGLMDKYKLSPGSKIFFEETGAGILLKQIDSAFIKNAKGIIQKKRGEKPMAEWWATNKAQENTLEERKMHLLNQPEDSYKKAIKIKRKK
jgi:AbrB family looped-hinge helix DNA binding protein